MPIFFVVHAVGVATVLLIVAYFILVAAQRAIGLTSALGRLLALWLFVIAAVVVGGAVTAPMFGGKPFGLDMPGPHWRWMHREGAPEEPPPAPSAEPAPPATPAPAPEPSGG